MKIGIYAPYLRACGGGEKYIGQIAEILSKENNVEFLTLNNIDLSEIESRLNLDLSRVTTKQLHLRGLSIFLAIEMATKEYELFINQEHMTTIPSHAKKSVLIQEVPFQNENGFTNVQKLCHKAAFILDTQNWARYHKTRIFDSKWATYDEIIVNSYFTKKYIERYCGKIATVLNPPVDTELFASQLDCENIILSVGRLSAPALKKQILMIRAFKKICNQDLANWEYHLVGGSMDTSEERSFIKKCEEESRGYPIYIHVNEPFNSLIEINGRAKIFWHAKGFGEPENHPERLEHFGMATLEAMAAGCVPVVVNKGGHQEIVTNGLEGFLWDSVEELMNYTLKLADDATLWEKMRDASIRKSECFGIKLFKDKVKRYFCESNVATI